VVRPVAGFDDWNGEGDTDYVATSPSNDRSDRPTDPNVGGFIAPVPKTTNGGDDTTGDSNHDQASGTTDDSTSTSLAEDAGRPPTDGPDESESPPTDSDLVAGDLFDAGSDPPPETGDSNPDWIDDGREDGNDGDRRKDGIDDDWIDWTAEVREDEPIDDDWLNGDTDDVWADRFGDPDA